MSLFKKDEIYNGKTSEQVKKELTNKSSNEILD